MEISNEIDEFYEKEIERIDKEFFDNLKKNKEKDVVIKNYRDKLNLIKRDYEKKYKKFLEDQKFQIQKNKERIINNKTKKKDEKIESFNVKKINFDDISKKEIPKLKKDMFYFRLNLKFRKIYNKIPISFLIFYFKFKFLYKRLIIHTKKIIFNIYDFLKKKILDFFNYIRDLFIKLYELIKKLMLSIKKLFLKLKLKKGEK
ncbi:MAG: hypothetical protein QXW97_04620 [Candidatus Pacearchaeota archaeon]